MVDPRILLIGYNGSYEARCWYDDPISEFFFCFLHYFGDAIRDIDWKQTLRHGRAIVREYQDERDQSVVFLLDCGLILLPLSVIVTQQRMAAAGSARAG